MLQPIPARQSRAAWSLPVLILSLLSVGCGSDSKGPSAPDKPQPTALTIQAGDGQSAVAASQVAVKPSVRVTGSQGAISGVRVTFAVAQGGGSLTGATPTTGSDGVATVGSWTLGAQAGTQRLTATVSGLTPVTFTATATNTEGEAELTTQTVGPGGGTLVTNWPGSPLNGSRLTLDPGALRANASLTLSTSPLTGLTLPVGVTVLTPGLGISGPSETLNASVALTLPTPTGNQGKLLLLAMGDPATGRMILLPTINQNTSGVTALLPSLDARNALTALPSRSSLFPLTARVGAASLANQGDLPASLIFMVAINPELLNQDFDTGFRPGVDDWDFPRTAIADLSFLRLPSDGDRDFPVADDGVISTSLWYFINRRKAGGKQLSGMTQLLAGEPQSSRDGIRWAALAELDVPPINQTGSLLLKEWDDWATDNPGKFLWLQFQGIKALMLTTLKQPVPVVLMDTDNPDDFNKEAHPLAIAYQTVGNTLYLAWGGSPGTPIQVKFSESGMTPFTVTNDGNGRTMTVRAIGGIHYLNVVNDAKLAAQFRQVEAGTIGKSEGWPEATLHWEKDQLDTARVYLAEELRIWWQCAQCPDHISTPPQLPSSASHVQRFQMIGIPHGDAIKLSDPYTSAKLTPEKTFEAGEKLRREGFLLLHPYQNDAGGWLDWKTAVFKKLELEPSEAEIKLSGDSTITLTVTPSETPPAGTSYRWLLRTDDGADSVETATPTHTRDFKQETTGWLIFSALEGTHKRIIARDSIKVISESTIGTAWRLTTAHGSRDLYRLWEAGTGGDGNLALIRQLAEVPTSTIIAIDETPPSRSLRVRLSRTGQWEPGPIPPFDQANEDLIPLGELPATVYSFGSFFSQWNSSSWQLLRSDSEEKGHSLSGMAPLGSTLWDVKDGGLQSGPSWAVRLYATIKGENISGWFLIYRPLKDLDQKVYIMSPQKLDFTGVRIR